MKKLCSRALIVALAFIVGTAYTFSFGAPEVRAVETTSSQVQDPAAQQTAAADTVIDVRAYDATATSLSIQWTKEEGVGKYTVYRSTKKNKGYKKIGTTTKLKFTSKKLSEKRNYYYKVTAKAADGTKYTSNIVRKVKVKGKYNRTSPFGVKMTAKQQKQVKNAVAKFVNTEIKHSWPAWKKALAAYEYVQDITVYAPWNPGEGPATPDTAWGALIDHQAWCSGYSMAYKALCDAMGIKCAVKQKAKSASHVWNVVTFGGKKYKVDTQGGTETISTKCSAARQEIQRGKIENVQSAMDGGSVVLTWDPSPYADMTYEVYRLKKFRVINKGKLNESHLPVFEYVGVTSGTAFTDSSPKYIAPYGGYYYHVEAHKDGFHTDTGYVLQEQ